MSTFKMIAGTPTRVSEKHILWDHSSLGPPQLCHPMAKRNATVILKDRIVGLASRTLQSMKTTEGVFLCSVNTDKSSEGLVIAIDRFEEKQRQPTLMIPGDFEVPVWFGKKNDVMQKSVTDYIHDVKSLVKKCANRFEVDLSNVMKINVQCNIEGANCVARVEALMPSTTFKFIPIPPMPVAATALFSSLTSNSRQTLYKSGLLTVDQSRKIVYLLENDPRVTTTQLVGIWLSGVDVVHHPYVWAACLRYVTCASYINRICLPPKPFLLAICTTVSLEPEYYDCFVLHADNYYLSKGECSLTVTKVPSFSSNITVVDLILEKDPANLQLLSEARSIFLKETNEKTISQKPAVNVQSNVDDFPRLIPIAQQVYYSDFKPLVPDLSLLSEGGYESEKHVRNEANDDYNVLGRKLPLQTLDANSRQTFEKRIFAGKSSQIQNPNIPRGTMRCNDENKPPLPTKSPRPFEVPEVVSSSHFHPTSRPENFHQDVNFPRNFVRLASPVPNQQTASPFIPKANTFEGNNVPVMKNPSCVRYSDNRRRSVPAMQYGVTQAMACGANTPSRHVSHFHENSSRTPYVRRSLGPDAHSNKNVISQHTMPRSPNVESEVEATIPKEILSYGGCESSANPDVQRFFTCEKIQENVNNEMSEKRDTLDSMSHLPNAASVDPVNSEVQSDRRQSIGSDANSLEIQKMIEEQDQKLLKLQEQIQQLLEVKTTTEHEEKAQPELVSTSKDTQSECDEKSEIYQMLKQQDQQLRRLQEQINSVLELHQSPVQKQLETDSGLGVSSDPGVTNIQCCETRRNRTCSHCRQHANRTCQENSSVPQDGAENLSLRFSNLNVQTVCEPPPSLPPSIYVDMKDYEPSCLVQMSREAASSDHSSESSDAEEVIRCASNSENPASPDEMFCHKLLGNINNFLEKRAYSENAAIVENERYGFDSFLLPNLNYQTMHLSNSDSDLGKLAVKYLGKSQIQSMLTSTKMFLEQKAIQYDGQPSDTTLYGLSANNISYSTKMYLERYGLMPYGDKTHKEKSMWVFSEYRNGKSSVPLLPKHGTDDSNMSRILDMEKLKKKPKLL